MRKTSLRQLAAMLQQTNQPVDQKLLEVLPDDVLISGISIDSRSIRAGECFVAVAGNNFDGHDFVSDAFTKGASCAVINFDAKLDTTDGKPIIRVRDTIEALGNLAREYRRLEDFKVIAITGSVGKTTTCRIVAQVLGRYFNVYQSPKSFNNNIGVPLTLLGAGVDVEIIVCELGTNHPGEIAHLTSIAQPDIAVVTNVYPAHLEGFGNLDAIAQEKLSIAEDLRENGVLIVNGENEKIIEHCGSKKLLCYTFGISHAENIRRDNTSSRFMLDNAEVVIPLPGTGNIENALAAWAVCSRFGLSADDFAGAIRELAPEPMRTEILHAGSITIINDCYNANPASMENALEILATIEPEVTKRRVFICGDMAELGQQAENLHVELGLSIAKAKVGLVLAVGKLAKLAAEAAKKAAEREILIKSFPDAESTCNNLHEFVRDYDIVLVKGSRAAELELVVEKLKEIFSLD